MTPVAPARGYAPAVINPHFPPSPAPEPESQSSEPAESGLPHPVETFGRTPEVAPPPALAFPVEALADEARTSRAVAIAAGLALVGIVIPGILSGCTATPPPPSTSTSVTVPPQAERPATPATETPSMPASGTVETPTAPVETPAPATIVEMRLLDGEITEDGATFQVPAGTRQLEFDDTTVTALDAQGNVLGRQTGIPERARATTLHTAEETGREALLTEGDHGETVVNVPAGTRTIQVFQAQTTFDGTILAMDAKGQILATEHNTDFRLEIPSADPLEGAVIEPMMTITKAGATRIVVPGGTRELMFNDAQAGNDGSVLALNAQGRVLQLHPNWGGFVEVSQPTPLQASPEDGVLFHGEPYAYGITLAPGTRVVEIDHGTIRLQDASGHLLARQDGTGMRVRANPFEP